MRRPILLSIVFALGCGGGEDPPATGEEVGAIPSAQAPATAPAGPPLPEVRPLPATLDLDPCALLTDSDLQSMGLDPARVERAGWADRVPDGDAAYPLVSCSWWAEAGLPLLWIHVQDGGASVSPPDDAMAVGEGAWTSSNLGRGRDELRVLAGDRLLRIISQALDLPGTSEERNLEVARILLPRIEAPPGNGLVGGAPSAWGFPQVDPCSVLSDPVAAGAVGVGDTVWRIPAAAEERIAVDTGEGDHRGCIWQSDRSENRRLILRLLGPEGVQESESLYSRAEDGTVGGRPARYVGSGNERLQVMMEEGGALEVVRQNLPDPWDEEPRAQLERLAGEALEAMGLS